MYNESSEEQFEDYIQKLRQKYQDDPKRAIKEARFSLERLSSSDKQLLSKENKKIFFIILYFVIIAITGLINYTTFPMFIGGFVFFAAGLLIGLFVEKFGLIFLFSHGMTGLGLLLGTELSGLLTSPFISDAPIYIYIMLGMIFLLVILGLITTILYNLSDKLNDNPNNIYIPLILFGMAIILAQVVSRLAFVKYGIETLIK